jgi:hypothetical protein
MKRRPRRRRRRGDGEEDVDADDGDGAESGAEAERKHRLALNGIFEIATGKEDLRPVVVWVPPKGWLQDLQYYVMNNCKWPAVFLASDEHPFPRWERGLDLFCVLGWSLFLSSYIAAERWAYENPDADHSHIEDNFLSRGLPYVFEYVFMQSDRERVGLSRIEAMYVGFVCVSLPMVIIGELNYEIMACPCLEVDRSRFSPRMWCVLDCCKGTLKTYSRFQIRLLATICSFSKIGPCI